AACARHPLPAHLRAQAAAEDRGGPDPADDPSDRARDRLSPRHPGQRAAGRDELIVSLRVPAEAEGREPGPSLFIEVADRWVPALRLRFARAWPGHESCYAFCSSALMARRLSAE